MDAGNFWMMHHGLLDDYNNRSCCSTHSDSDRDQEPPKADSNLSGDKYSWDPETKRITALRSIPRFGVNAGDIGGRIDSPLNLAQDGDCWVFENAQVRGSAFVFGYARVFGHAIVRGPAIVCDSACVGGSAVIEGRVVISGDMQVGHMTSAERVDEVVLGTPISTRQV